MKNNIVIALNRILAIPPAPKDFKVKTYYHGTPTSEKARSIWKEGIRPDLSEIPPSEVARPVANRVYVTDRLPYAIIYALGGDMAGVDCSSLIKKYGQYGYIFEIDGKELLADIQPDEDQVGESVYKHLQNVKLFPWLADLAEDYLADEPPLEMGSDYDEVDETGQVIEDIPDFYNSLMDQIKDGLYVAWIEAGHILLPVLTDQQKIEIMKHFGNIAHLGLIKPKKGWRFDRSLSKKLKKDGSNFFELAELVYEK